MNRAEDDTRRPRLPPNSDLKRYDDIRGLIANPDNPTPLLRLKRVAPKGGFDLYAKLEWFNPFGSIKDRPALYMLQAMQEAGLLKGKDLVEPTSGNTGIALAALASLMGRRLTVTIPEAVPEEKRILLRMLGAEVRPTPDDARATGHPKDAAIALAQSLVRGENSRIRFAMPNQYENPHNVRAHYETTGPEIWRQTEGRVRYFFAGLGTCGTITGVGRFLKERDPSICIVAVEPQRDHRIPGLKNMEESKPPGILDRRVIDEVIRVDDGPAYEMTKRLFREEALMAGPSTGAIVHAACEYGRARQGVAVVVSPDSGLKYTSFFADVLGDEGNPQV